MTNFDINSEFNIFYLNHVLLIFSTLITMIYYECSGVFKAINSTVDGILSLGELLDMAGRLELFLTEEEGSRIFSLMDIDGDEKVRIVI